MTSVNYTLEKLISEDGEREHILLELEAIRKAYGIQNCSVLELGCGNGRNLRIFGQDNKIAGVDGLADAVEHGRSQGLDFRVHDLNLPLTDPSASYDWILLLDVLEHLDKPEVCLREAHRLLRPGGHLIVNVPNHFTLSARIRILLGAGIDAAGYFPAAEDWNYPHLRFFRRESIESLLSRVGFAQFDARFERFAAVPFGRELRALGMSAALAGLARWRPNVFCSGFFYVARK